MQFSHRIKNNLQIVVGLIGYEARLTGAPSVQGYKAMQARIGAIAELYDLISHAGRGGTIMVDSYLRQIAKTMSATLLSADSDIKIEVDAETLAIDPDRAMPFGLLVNELGTNAIKHAFPDGVGRVVLRVTKRGDSVELSVSDNGIGLQDREAAKEPGKRGADYIAIFVRQLGGTVTMNSAVGTGTTVKINLPAFLMASDIAGVAA